MFHRVSAGFLVRRNNRVSPLKAEGIPVFAQILDSLGSHAIKVGYFLKSINPVQLELGRGRGKETAPR